MERNSYFTVRHAAEFAGVAPCTIRKWLDNGLLTKRTFNGYNVAIEREELEGLVEVKKAKKVKGA